MNTNEALRRIPKTDEILADARIVKLSEALTHSRVMTEIREELDVLRQKLIKHGSNAEREVLRENVIKSVAKRLENLAAEDLRRVINATGVIIHTNLGRAPLSENAARLVYETCAGYSNLEFSTVTGKRRNRMYYLERLIADITCAEAALVVNNNAAAVWLTLNTLAARRGVVLSRGEMVEVGDSFRISEIIAQSGCDVTEVGTTNKTKLSDYEKAITEDTAVLLKVHTSNFRIIGFTESVEPKSMAKLAHDKNLIAIEDMGSGVLLDLSEYGLPRERTVTDALNDGMDIVTFSGDKLLGGPQAGIIAGKKVYIDMMKQNQLLRCLRLDKMCMAALIGTLKSYRSSETVREIPIINALTATNDEILKRAEKLYMLLLNNTAFSFELVKANAMTGGGALPVEDIESYGVAVLSEWFSADKLANTLREQAIPIITVRQNDRVVLNCRTLTERDFEYIKDVFTKLAELR